MYHYEISRYHDDDVIQEYIDLTFRREAWYQTCTVQYVNTMYYKIENCSEHGEVLKLLRYKVISWFIFHLQII